MLAARKSREVSMAIDKEFPNRGSWSRTPRRVSASPLVRPTAAARAASEADMKGAGARIRSRDRPGFEDLNELGIGRIGRGLEGYSHYLPKDRFLWWAKGEHGDIPSTGPIGVGGPSLD